MSKLAAAQAWARRGLRVFPLQSGGKLPLEQGWTVAATTDPDVVRAMWSDPVTGAERDHNVGVLTTGLVALDVDTKNGKPGLATFLDLGLDFGTTLTTRTPTGGYHCYFRGIGRDVGNAPLGPGLDVRSHNGYLLAPGSTIDGAAYEVEFDLPVVDFPPELRPLLKPPRSRRDAAGVSVELDQPEALEMAAHWLRREAPVAVQGMNGDDTTYRVCCRVRDLGVSEGAALDLLLDAWNERCEPPWSAAELGMKVENAYRYATGEAGSASAAAVFADVVRVDPPRIGERDTIAPTPQGLIRYGNMMREDEIEKRPWLIEGFLMEGHVTLLTAPGGAGKSLLALIVAAHLAVGRPFWGFEVKRAGRSILYNAEDDRAEVSRRFAAVCRAYGIDVDEATSKICVLGSDDIQLQVTSQQPPTIKRDHVDMLMEAVRDPELVMLAVDPLVELHTGRENDAVDMRYVMSVLRSVAREGRVAELVVHHNAKANQNVRQAGNQDAGRGSTAIAASARVAVTLETAKEADCLAIGAPLADRRKYVRFDGAKVSYAAAPGEPRWLKWRSDDIASGDSVGVLVEHDARSARQREAGLLAERIAAILLASGGAAMAVSDAARALAGDHAPTEAPGDADEISKRILALLSTPVRLATGRAVGVTRTGVKVASVVID